ncbi:MAG TPA: acylphosphatase [Gemmatimonadaceae bacterium]
MRMHVVVSGRVQGVGFRWFVREAAIELGLAGWVRNRSDGNVEVAADGDDAGVSHFRELLRKGPPHAMVVSVDDVPSETKTLPHPFEIAR